MFYNNKKGWYALAYHPFCFSSKTGPVLAASGASTTAGEHAAHLGCAQGAQQLQLLLAAARAGFLLQFLISIDDRCIMVPALLAGASIVGWCT